MRVAIIYHSSLKSDDNTKEMASNISKGLDFNGHDVTLIDAKLDDKKISMFEYLVFFSKIEGLFNVKPEKSFEQFIAGAGNIQSKRVCAIVKNKFRGQRFLLNFMRMLEKEGVVMHSSFIVKNKEEALGFAKRLNIVKEI